jgi:hypothetical protein
METVMRLWIVPFIGIMSVVLPDPPSPVTAPEASHSKDWVSPESLAAAVYSVVSGPAGHERDWDRYRALFRKGAVFMTLSDANGAPVDFGVEEYIKWYGPAFEERGVFEREIWGRTERFRHVAHRWSTEEFRWERPDGPASGRSMVTMQFVHDGTRWWIASMIWEPEDDTNRVPRTYLPRAPSSGSNPLNRR